MKKKQKNYHEVNASKTRKREKSLIKITSKKHTIYIFIFFYSFLSFLSDFVSLASLLNLISVNFLFLLLNNKSDLTLKAHQLKKLTLCRRMEGSDQIFFCSVIF
jgi:hypothetical protein